MLSLSALLALELLFSYLFNGVSEEKLKLGFEAAFSLVLMSCGFQQLPLMFEHLFQLLDHSFITKNLLVLCLSFLLRDVNYRLLKEGTLGVFKAAGERIWELLSI